MLRFTLLFCIPYFLLYELDSLAEGQIDCSPKTNYIDLSYATNSDNQYWPGDNYSGFQLRTIATLEKDGALSKAVSFPKHLGTHIDAPNHFEANQPDVSQLGPDQLFGPCVVIDISMKTETDSDAMLMLEDIQEWERDHGKIPKGAIVFLKTGWGRF